MGRAKHAHANDITDRVDHVDEIFRVAGNLALLEPNRNSGIQGNEPRLSGHFGDHAERDGSLTKMLQDVGFGHARYIQNESVQRLVQHARDPLTDLQDVREWNFGRGEFLRNRAEPAVVESNDGASVFTQESRDGSGCGVRGCGSSLHEPAQEGLCVNLGNQRIHRPRHRVDIGSHDAFAELGSVDPAHGDRIHTRSSAVAVGIVRQACGHRPSEVTGGDHPHVTQPR